MSNHPWKGHDHPKLAKDSQMQLASGTSFQVKDEGRSQPCARIPWALDVAGKIWNWTFQWSWAPQNVLCVISSENTSSHLRMQEVVRALQKGKQRTYSNKRQGSNYEPVSVSLWSLETHWNTLVTEPSVSKPGSNKIEDETWVCEEQIMSNQPNSL